MATIESSHEHRRIPELLRPDQVARMLQVTPRTIRRWGAAGVLERVRLGDRLTRYRAEDVAALVDPSTSETTAANGGLTKLAGAGDGHQSLARATD